jgi:hypothetical protein
MTEKELNNRLSKLEAIINTLIVLVIVCMSSIAFMVLTLWKVAR